MRLFRYVCASLVLAALQIGSTFSLSPAAISADVVISQIYGGGGNAGAPFTHDYIELYNRGAVPVPLDGWSVQYASATGTGNLGANNGQITELTGVIGPGEYLLIQEAGGTTGSPLPPAEIVDPTPINMSATAGKVALARRATTLGCNTLATCTSNGAVADIVDLVGYGGANYSEGLPTAAPNNTLAVFRRCHDGNERPSASGCASGVLDSDQNRNDTELASPLPRTGPARLSIADATVAEGNSGVRELALTVSLSKQTMAAVSYTIATADGTATAASDYEPLSIGGAIDAGSLTATHTLNIHGDLLDEPSETFFVELSSIVGAGAGRTRATVTISNDDITVTPIHVLQGAGAVSAFTDREVATTGIVTARKGNGFFMQTPADGADELPETSQAIFVFTRTTPAVSVGDAVIVTGRLVEFGSGGDSLTEITNPLVEVITSGHPVPTAVPVSALLALRADLAFRSRNEQLERFEAMLVSAPAMDVVGPTTSPAFGEIYAVVAGVSRPMREEGVDLADTMPAGALSTIPRFDGNFERIMLDSNDLLDEGTGAPRIGLNVPAGVQIVNVAGPLDYAFGNYRIALTSAAVPAGARAPQPVPQRSSDEFTIGHVNLENYRAVSAARQQKAARVLVEILRTPDILGLIEIGGLEDLQSLAAEINARAGTNYAAYLRDNDGEATGSEQNIGYLVNTDRVEVLSERQEYFGKTWEIGGIADLLHDRPPYVLEARVRHTGTEATVILNHLKSLIEVNSLEPYGDGTVTVGHRNREKRRLQAEDVADLISLHAADNLVVLGDMNAFEMNDGYADLLGILQGSPAGEAFVTNFTADRWPHTLTNLVTTLPRNERYSYVFDGNAQVLDHVLVNDTMLSRLTGFAYTRNNADFPESFEADFSVTTRVSDHDAPVASFRAIADLSTTTTMPELVVSGSTFTYNIVVANSGDTARDVTATLTLPADATFTSVLAPSGWACSNALAAVTCGADTLGAGETATFLVSMTAACALRDGATLAAAATAASPTELNAGGNASNDTAAVSNPAPVISDVASDTRALVVPNHKMHDVRVTYATTDNCGPVTTTLSVGSNEPVNGTDDGNTAPDWQVLDGNLVRLRAERSGIGTGRIYTITITATDSAGHASIETAMVTVPRKR